MYTFDHFLVYDRSQKKWLLEGVNTRQSGVSDSKMTQILEINTKAAKGQITQKEAEKSLTTLASDLGISGFTWLVRNLPVYDEDSGWHTFDDYAKDLAQDSGVDKDSRLFKDPIGVGIDLMFRDFTAGDIQEWTGFGD